MRSTHVTLVGKNRVPTSLVTQNSMYFPGYLQVKAMKFPVNLAQNHNVCVDNVDMKKI